MYPTTAAVKVPETTFINSPSLSMGFFHSNAIAPRIAGMERRNEKRIATVFFSFLNKPKAIVEPDLEIPGAIDRP